MLWSQSYMHQYKNHSLFHKKWIIYNKKGIEKEKGMEDLTKTMN